MVKSTTPPQETRERERIVPHHGLASQPYVDVAGTLLEGPFYDEARNELRFVDIWEEKLYSLDLAQGPSSLRVIDTSTSIGCVDVPSPTGCIPAR